MKKNMEGHEGLPLTNAHDGDSPRSARVIPRNVNWAIWTICTVTFLFQIHAYFSGQSRLIHESKSGHKHEESSCLQVPALSPCNSSEQLQIMDQHLNSDLFRDASSKRLSDAVRIPTESFDDLGPVGVDKRWEIMYSFADYLSTSFPLVHERLTLEKINTHGLLYTWKGTNETLKPTLLMAHQDVVPVPASTVDAWTHPPFSGYNDGEYIWGRGASDCKNQLLGILEAVEALIGAGYTPHRSVLLPFGFDEEISGGNGAGYLAPFILERYGKDGIATIVDEGAGFTDAWGVKAALPGVGEKGYIDVHVTVRMPGGHSSIPPDHTGIGVMSEFITLIEADQYEAQLNVENPYLGLLTCGAEYAPKFPGKLKKLLHKRAKGSHMCKHRKDQLAVEAAKLGPGVRYLMQTSIAVDLINGGVKVNALPERTTAIINHRINIGEHSSDIQRKITRIAHKVVSKYNLTLHAFDEHAETPNSITLWTDDQHVLEPAPISPTDASSVTPWSVLSGTTRSLYGEDVIIAPGLMTGNTDTKHYWDLTKHIFRFTPGWDGVTFGLGNIHTVDERVSIKNHVNMVKWMSLFIRNMDEARMD